jgi:hypothetical protein
MRVRRSSLFATVAFVASALLSGSVFAGGPRNTTNAAWNARQAYQKKVAAERGGVAPTKVHARGIHYLGYLKGNDHTPFDYTSMRDPRFDYNKVVVYEGAERGPGSKGATVGHRNIRVAAVPAGASLTPQQRIDMTLMSKDLSSRGAARVRAALTARGFAVKAIKLGDYYSSGIAKYDPTRSTLIQKPFTRESGSIRYTVTFADGTKKRVLVETNASGLITGADVLGKVEFDNDRYENY